MVNSEWGGVMETFWAIIDFFKSGGFFMYPILLTLALGTAIIIERIIFLSRAWIDGRTLWSRIEPDIRAKRLAEAIQHCKESACSEHIGGVVHSQAASTELAEVVHHLDLENHIE